MESISLKIRSVSLTILSQILGIFFISFSTGKVVSYNDVNKMILLGGSRDIFLKHFHKYFFMHSWETEYLQITSFLYPTTFLILIDNRGYMSVLWTP